MRNMTLNGLVAVFFTLAVLLALSSATLPGCDLTVGAFQPDVVFLVAEEREYFRREGIDNLCSVPVFTSGAGYASLQNGSLDVLNAAFDNVLFRKHVLNPPVNFTLAAGSDMGHGYVALARSDTLETLNGARYAADGPLTAFIIFAYEMARLSGVDLSTLTNVSGFNNDQRNALANGEVVNGQTADWVFQAFLYGTPEFYEPRWPNLVEIGKFKDFVWPIQGSAYTVRTDAQDDPVVFQKLRRFFRGMLRSYMWTVKPKNKQDVITILKERLNVTRVVARKVYDISIGAIREQTGMNPFLVLSRRGLFNNVVLRFNQGRGPVPSTVDLDSGPGKLVDLRALHAAFEDLDLGSAFECYENNLLDCANEND